MSRLDRHVARVQNKLALQRFLVALAWTALALSVAVWLVVLVDRLLGYALPRKDVWLWAGVGSAVVAAIAYAIYRRPTAHEAAVAIDEKLALKEKFSTALYVRPLSDPFAAAAVRDAETTADNVSLNKQFPLKFPKIANWTVAAMIVAFCTAYFLHPMDLFGHQVAAQKRALEVEQVAQTKKSVQDAIAKVETIAKAFPNDNSVQIAKKDLENLLNQPITDTAKTQRSAAEALQNLDKQIQQQIAQSKSVAQAQNDQRMLADMQPSADEKGPVADAHRDIAKGDYEKAVKDLQQAVDKFDKMDEKEQKKAAQQMAKLAQQLQKAANNPQQQQKMQQQLQQVGATQQQAQQIQQLAQQAAAGNQAAQQQLAQMAKQMQQQMPAAQQQAMQQAIQQAQAQAGGQQAAQQMGQAAQQMAQAMQQAAQGQQQQGGQGNQNPQAGNNPQQMANAAQNMQQQLQQMQAIAADAQQQAAAQNAAQQAAQQAANQANGQGQNGQGNQPGQGQQGNKPGQGKGQWAKGNPNQNGKGWGGPGKGNGGGPGVEEAPFDVKQEIAPVQNNDKGKYLASTFVKAGSIKGDSHAQLQQAVQSAERDATDDVDSEAISGDAKKAVKGYFGQLAGDAAK
jgi:hypothetical protein